MIRALSQAIYEYGIASKDVAAVLGLHEHTVGKWRRRFLKDRCEGLLDEARPADLEVSMTIRSLG